MTAPTRKALGDGEPAADPHDARARIVEAAGRLFRDKGFEATTVRDIAAAVGMQSGSPFYHFASKHEMLHAVMEQALREALQRAERAADPALPAAEQLRALLRAHAELLHRRDGAPLPVLLYEWRSLPAELRQRLAELKARYEAIWQDTLKRLHDEGRLAVEPKPARLLVLGAINFSATWFRANGEMADALDLDALADAAARLLLGAAPPPLAAPSAALRGLRAELQSLKLALDAPAVPDAP